MRYSEDLIEEIRSRNDIVDVISGYVKLQKKGSSYFGLCPFHNEKSASFSVSRQKQMYYCFGCGAGGNVITFIMEYENYTFPEAVKLLADRAGITLPEIEYSKKDIEQANQRDRILEINKEAATYYYTRLRSDSGKFGYDYLLGRGLSEETIKKFGLGYADKYSDDLYRYLKSKGYKDDDLTRSGLFGFDERSGMHDKFWNRVMFPIFDVNGKVIGFGGRVLGDGKPKYLNSPETEVFDKSRNLYGLNLARRSRRRQIILCEGYMDVISMHQAGFDNAVASLGTALTTRQASLLKRYTDEVFLLYDSDQAGVRAALRALPILKDAGVSARVVDLKPHKDPDEFIQTLGAEAFEERLSNAENGFMFEVEIASRDYHMNDPQSKTDFANDIADRLNRFDEEIERTNYTDAFSRKYNIDPKDMRRLVAKRAMAGTPAAGYRRPRSGVARKEKESGIDKSQKLMLTWLVTYPGTFEATKEYIGPDDFTTPLFHQVAELLYAQHAAGEVNPAKILTQFVDADQYKEVAAVFNETLVLEDEKERDTALTETVYRLKKNSNAYQASHLDPGDIPGLQEMITRQNALESFERGKVRLHISVD